IDRKSKSEERQSSRERIGGDSEQTVASFPPPHIEYQKKVIIVDSSEIYDCLDLGRRIDVVWPNEMMRLCGGRSNFNRTLFLIQIGDRYVPVGENGVKEYNTVGSDERIKIVHMPKEELKLDTDEHEILEEKSEDDSFAEDYVLSADHSV
ncbi:Protein pecanex, partial [Pseudolycoriella hygida]